MEQDNPLIAEIIRTELLRYRFFYSDDEKLMIKNESFLDLITSQLEKLKLYTWLTTALILLLSSVSIYLFIYYGRNETTFSLFLGLFFWVIIIALTYLFAKEIVAKRQSMNMIIELLNR